MDWDLTAIGAGIAVGLSALATAIVQAKVGAAAVGAILEKKELTGVMIVLIAIPETMVVLGFVVAVLIIYAK
ncbi:MAG: ATPase [Nitrospinota bacterium]